MKELDYPRFPVLVVDDEQDNLDAFRFAFRKSFALRYAQGGAEALDRLEELDPAVVVTDQRMPGMSGIELLRHVVQMRPHCVGILLTAYTDLPLLLEAINSGAVYRYIQKPWDSKELSVILRQAIERFYTVRENARLREQLTRYAGYLETEQRDPLDFGELSTDSPAHRSLLHRIEQLASCSDPVLVVGEPGTEMDLFARALHISSNREDRPFVQVACPSLSPEALARELFGWEKGAFEGALNSHAGRLELADRGTLLLAGVTELSESVSEGLETLVTEHKVRRIGGQVDLAVDVRIVATTSRTPETIAGSSGFGRRVAQSPLFVTPLRERMEELPRLCERLLSKFARRHASTARHWSNDALARLQSYDWPGNMRELETVIERAVLLCRETTIGPEHLAIGGRSGLGEPHSDRAARPDGLQVVDLPAQLDDIERRELCTALDRCNGNKAEVARMLGIHRTTLYYRLKRLGIEA